MSSIFDENHGEEVEHSYDRYEEPDFEPPSGVWFKFEIWEDVPEDPIIDDYDDPNWTGHGTVVVHESTNDNLDQGYPSQYASWSLRFRTVEEAKEHTGVSRTGWNGAKVEVFLNGEKI